MSGCRDTQEDAEVSEEENGPEWRERPGGLVLWELRPDNIVVASEAEKGKTDF